MSPRKPNEIQGKYYAQALSLVRQLSLSKLRMLSSVIDTEIIRKKTRSQRKEE